MSRVCWMAGATIHIHKRTMPHSRSSKLSDRHVDHCQNMLAILFSFFWPADLEATSGIVSLAGASGVGRHLQSLAGCKFRGWTTSTNSWPAKVHCSHPFLVVFLVDCRGEQAHVPSICVLFSDSPMSEVGEWLACLPAQCHFGKIIAPVCTWYKNSTIFGIKIAVWALRRKTLRGRSQRRIGPLKSMKSWASTSWPQRWISASITSLWQRAIEHHNADSRPLLAFCALLLLVASVVQCCDCIVHFWGIDWIGFL